MPFTNLMVGVEYSFDPHSLMIGRYSHRHAKVPWLQVNKRLGSSRLCRLSEVAILGGRSPVWWALLFINGPPSEFPPSRHPPEKQLYTQEYGSFWKSRNPIHCCLVHTIQKGFPNSRQPINTHTSREELPVAGGMPQCDCLQRLPKADLGNRDGPLQINMEPGK